MQDTPVLTQKWLMDKILVQLYAGLYYDRQGKKILAAQLIQEQAVINLLDLIKEIEKDTFDYTDSHIKKKRFDQKFQKSEMELANFIQGYSKNYESARAILSFLEKHFIINRELAQAICALGI